MIDLATVLLLFAFFVFTIPSGAIAADPADLERVKFWGGVAAGGAVAGLGLLFALAGHPERLGRAALRIERVLPARLAATLARFVETFAQGLAVMRQPLRLVEALVVSFLLWLSIALQIWLVSQAFHITFPYTGTFLVLMFLVVGVAVPTPGGVGGFHEAFRIGATSFFGADNDTAVGAAIVLHAISVVPVVIVGLLFIIQDGLKIGGLARGELE
jgi:uncharacterized membrane protein YbhN (UPF0104 family)